MIYNVFSGTLNPAQSINQSWWSIKPLLRYGDKVRLLRIFRIQFCDYSESIFRFVSSLAAHNQAIIAGRNDYIIENCDPTPAIIIDMEAARWIVILRITLTLHSIHGCGILTHIEIGENIYSSDGHWCLESLPEELLQRRTAENFKI